MRGNARFAVVLLAVLVAGCGFQLRGSDPLPPVLARPWLDAPDRYTPLYAALTSRLRGAGVTLATTPTEATAAIRLSVDETGRELLSVSAQNRPGEYEGYYRAEFSVSAGGRELLAPQQVSLTRDYGYDETAVLAKEHEEQSLRAALADEIASLILRRLTALEP
jgi:LPS-assembly lipoprotein